VAIMGLGVAWGVIRTVWVSAPDTPGPLWRLNQPDTGSWGAHRIAGGTPASPVWLAVWRRFAVGD
jgi:hypothetical protein